MGPHGRTDGVADAGSALHFMKKRKHTILRLGTYLMKYRFLMVLAFAMTVASNVFSLMGPMLSGYAIDAIEPGIGSVDFKRVLCGFLGPVLSAKRSDDHNQPEGGLSDAKGCF